MHDDLFINYNPTFTLNSVSPTLKFLVVSAVWGYRQRSYRIGLNP